VFRQTLQIRTSGRGSYEITAEVERAIADSGVETGLCHLFIRHTSASLIICENADPGVRRDLDAYFDRLVPDGDPLFEHTAEGIDDMPAHIRSILTQSSLTVPVEKGRSGLGTWQGIFVYEHRLSPHRRNVTVTIQGLMT
jgi:secondary thiamine-phosphate synthase enzyme